ncbi:MmgE/PrpD family protein [Pseudomonas typographi]|uniref:MmgE/PrpD family protein n=1 Tax=Pseudomonas typographi TaxID=2715964 RepID=A0ABR7Z1X5_9PSED|nr:MmgE/PrpD family protein [Pseudomonas typographi]MBD1599480.1 MmgE/PrpD family protein [Pseudomonas typographi]
MRDDPIVFRLAHAVAKIDFTALPIEVVEAAKHLISDCLLVAAAGQSSPLANGVRAAITASVGSCRTWFASDLPRMGPQEASFLNAYHAGLLGYGSINAKAHADAVCLPAAWAVAEQQGRSGAELIWAFVAGSEIVGRLSHHASHRSAGWSHTSVYGSIGAAVSAGVLLRLTPEQLAHGIALSIGQAGGTQQASVESAASRRLLPAFAARNGVFAAQLAAAGVTGPRFPVEGQFGLRALYEAGDDKLLFQHLWSDWRLLDTSLKPYPVSACSQAAIEALLHLQLQHALVEADILEIVAYVSPYMFRYVGAEFSLQGDLEMLGQFNLRYHLASALLRGPMALAHLTSDALMDAEVARVVGKVHLRVDPRNRSDLAPVTLSVTRRDGSTIEYVQQHPPGSRQQPMSATALALKAHQCGLRGGFDGRELLTKVSELDQIACLGGHAEAMDLFGELER